jgi:hypothetical protein
MGRIVLLVWQTVARLLQIGSEQAVRRRAYSGAVVSFEFAGSLYELTENQATFLAETLRNYAKGKCPAAVKQATDMGGNPRWTDGALAVADFIEEQLVGNLGGPLPLEGKAAEATFWTLRLMRGLGRSTLPTDAAALRDALATSFVAAVPSDAETSTKRAA